MKYLFFILLMPCFAKATWTFTADGDQNTTRIVRRSGPGMPGAELFTEYVVSEKAASGVFLFITPDSSFIGLATDFMNTNNLNYCYAENDKDRTYSTSLER